MQTIEYVPCGTYYVPFNSQLIQFRIESVTFTPDSPSRSCVTYKGLHQGSSLTFYAGTEFYNSKEDYLNGNPVPYMNLTQDSICRNFGCHKHGDNFTGWIFTNELAEQIFFKFSEIQLVNWFWKFTPVKDGYVFHEKVYPTRQELLDDNIIHVINDDGTETEITGINLRLNFSDEQEQLICKFRELANQMYNAGIAICFDDNQYCLRAFNIGNFPEAEQVFEGCADDFERVVTAHQLQRICNVDFTTHEERCIGLCRKPD